MNTLKAEKRDMLTKDKKLRREGYVTGNIYGREMKEYQGRCRAHPENRG